MTNTDQEIRAELIKFIERYAPTLAEVAKVVTINETEKTCLLKSASDDSEFTAQLSAGEQASLLVIPKTGSVVFAKKAENGTYYITQYSEIEKIVMFGGELGGMVKINQLVEKLNNVEQELNKIINALNSWTPLPNDGGSALKTIFSANPATILAKTVVENLENKRITQ